MFSDFEKVGIRAITYNTKAGINSMFMPALNTYLIILVHEIIIKKISGDRSF